MFDKENSCLNCKFFFFFYIKEKTKFVITMNGACLSDNLSYNEKRKHICRLSVCDNFEQSAEAAIDKQKIEKVVRNMARDLKDIVEFISNEE